MRRAGAEAADNIGQMRFGGTEVRREAVGVQMRQQEGSGRRGIAGRIGARDRNEAGQKLHQRITVLLDPAKDLFADTQLHHVVSRSCHAAGYRATLARVDGPCNATAHRVAARLTEA
jgi:hypothetical protein